MKWTLIQLVVLTVIASATHAGEPLHQRVNVLMQSHRTMQGLPGAPAVASDLEFLRRVTLDLAGRIPTLAEIQAFEADPRSNRRLAVIDRLLQSNAFIVHFAQRLDVMLMERRGMDPHWDRFLRESLARRLGWDAITRHIVNPQADDATFHGAAGFIVKRLERYGQQPDDMPGLVRDVGRMFLGVDVQCAQCHDHLFVDAYQQVDYQGLFAFVGQAQIRRDTPFPAVSQKLMTTKVEFASVFDGEQQATGPRLPFGEEIPIPTFAKGEEYVEPPDRKTRHPGTPKFQPLTELAQHLAAKDNAAFATNFVNRIWWMLMGRGLVHPLDLSHPDNPASHPDVLELLAQEAAAHDYDIRWLVRELTQTETYQLAGRYAADVAAHLKESAYVVALERPLSAEQICRSMEAAASLPTNPLPPCESPADVLAPMDSERLADFREAFANPPKEPEIEYRPSVKAALFLRNNEDVQQLFHCDAGGAVRAAAALSAPKKIAERLYLLILCRRPTAEESDEAAAFLADGLLEETVSDLAWALATSAESLLNH